MYKIEGRWAGYILKEQHVLHFSEVEEAIRTIKESFNEGMTHYVHGTEMKIKVLCIDVLYQGRIIGHTDLKS